MLQTTPDVDARILLLSDGNETGGSARRIIPAAQRAGISIFSAAPPQTEGPDVNVETLDHPALVSAGMTFALQVTVRNRGRTRSATLQLRLDGKELGEERIQLEEGLNVLEIPYQIHDPGGHRIRVEVVVDEEAEEEGVRRNKVVDSAISVGPKPRILILNQGEASALEPILEHKGFAPELRAAEELEVDDLLKFNAVILEDLDGRSLSSIVLQNLAEYVEVYGGGLIVAGGENTYSDPQFRETALESLLPVTLEKRRPPRAEREPMALVLLIDRSNSMGYHFQNRLQRSRDQSKLIYAKKAALAVLRQLKDNDLVGVFAFDSQLFEIAALRKVRRNRSVLRRDIPRLQPGGGTDFYEALRSARRQLKASRAATKHVILLTDGDTNRAG